MKHTEQKLNEYGLSFCQDLYGDGSIEQRLFDNLVNSSAIVYDFFRHISTMIDDPATFQKKFEIPRKYDALADHILETITVFCSPEKEMVFCQTEDYLEQKYIISTYVGQKQKELLKSNKEFKMKHLFNPESAEEWLIDQLMRLNFELVRDPATLPARQRFQKELVDALLRDKIAYRKSN